MWEGLLRSSPCWNRKWSYMKRNSFPCVPRDTPLDSIVGISNEISLLKKEALKAAATQPAGPHHRRIRHRQGAFRPGHSSCEPRRLYPFVRINCAAIPRDLLESELFGYEQGAFTGALSKGKPGKFELATAAQYFWTSRRSSSEMQPKLLRVLEEKKWNALAATHSSGWIFVWSPRAISPWTLCLKTAVSGRPILFVQVIPLHIPPFENAKMTSCLWRAIFCVMSFRARAVTTSGSSRMPTGAAKLRVAGQHRELVNVLEGIASFLEGDVNPASGPSVSLVQESAPCF